MPLPFPRVFFRGAALAGLALLLLRPGALLADDNSTPPDQTLSDSVGDALAKIRPMLDAKDWAGAMRVIDDLIKTATPDSYDMNILLETRARILIQRQDYPGAIEPMEGALAIADRHRFNTTKQTMDILNLLAQLYNQTADDTKKTKAEQVAAYEKAREYMRRWFSLNTKPNEDISFYYCQLLYQEAVAKNGEHPDPELIKEARDEVEKVLTMSVHPKDTTYAFLLATLNQEQDYKRGSEILELMLAKNPSNKSYWGDLVMFYMMMGQSTKDEREIRRYNVRAINTIERAQALGFMRTPKDNFNLFTLYYNSNQFGTAADLLHEGLKAGTIDRTLANWQLLASSYEQTNQDFKSVEALKEAAEQFPKNGELDFKIAQVYYGLNNLNEAFAYSQIAMDKGGLAKPMQTFEFISYLAYELQKYDAAKMAIDKAIAFKNGNPDHQMLGLKNAIDDAIKEAKDKEDKKAAEKKAQEDQQSQ